MKTIFVVDDNNVNLLSAFKALSKYYRVFTLPSASSMFELLEKIRPDLILLDILMPKMDGFEALKLLKSNSQNAGIPVIFLTASDEEATKTEGFRLGAAGFFLKPFSQQILLDSIKPHLNEF